MSNNIYQQLIHNIPIGFALFQLYDSNQQYFRGIRIIEINESFTQATGLTQEEVVKQNNIQDFDLESSHFQLVLTAFEEVIRQSPMSDYIFHYQPLNRHFNVRSLVLENKRIALFIHDISQHTEDQDEKIAIIKTLNDIVFELDENSIFTNVYTADETQLFYPKSEIMGTKFEDLFPSGLAQKLTFSRLLAKQTGQKQAMVYPSIISGENRWYKAESQFLSVNQVNRF